MNYLFLGYLLVFLSTLGINEDTFGVRGEVDRRRKEHSSLRQSIQLDSWGFLSTYAPEPEYVGDIPSIKVVAGKDAVLRCVVENLGDRKVMWRFVEAKKLLSMGTNVFVRSDRIQVTTSNSASWFLHIKNVTQEDVGFYACQINTNPMKTQVGYLDVVEPPQFVTNMQHRNVTVKENSNVTLSCKATGHPLPVIKWRREDEQAFTIGGNLVREYVNDELTFVAVSRDHMATYLCVASNEVPPAISRRIYLDVKFPPLIWIQNNLVGARGNIDVNLECQTEGHPLTENYWLRDDEPIVSKSSRYQPHLARNFYRSYMRLTIRNLQPEDYGSYQCVAKNSIGEAQGTIKLFRQHLPAPPSARPVTEARTAFPTKRIVTVEVTTEKKVLISDIDRIENVNSPGNQEKYGDGRVVSDDLESSAIRTSILKSSMTFVYCVHLLWTNAWLNTR